MDIQNIWYVHCGLVMDTHTPGQPLTQSPRRNFDHLIKLPASTACPTLKNSQQVSASFRFRTYRTESWNLLVSRLPAQPPCITQNVKALIRSAASTPSPGRLHQQAP